MKKRSPHRIAAPPPLRNIYQGVFDLVPSRGQKRVAQIVEGAIRSYASVGIENTTYDSIAKLSKMSRQLVLHYFISKEAIFEMAVKYIRVNFQRVAVEAIEGVDDPVACLQAYVLSTFEWLRKYPAHVKVWNLNFYYCALHPKTRVLNTQLVAMGHERIASILQHGVEKGVFENGDLKIRAKQIQALVMGALITASTEDLAVEVSLFARQTAEAVLQLATGPRGNKLFAH